MPIADAVLQMETVLSRATSYTAIFGPVVGKDIDERKRLVDEQFNYLVRLVHPDKVDDESKAAATAAFQRLKEAREGAKRALEKGTYGEAFTKGKIPEASPKGASLKSAMATYALDATPFAEGDFSVIYKAVNGIGSEVLVKVASHPTNNHWLEHEAEMVQRFAGHRSASAVPAILDGFTAAGDGGQRYRVNVLPFRHGYVSVADLVRAFPGGLDPTQVGWVGRRVLAQVMAGEIIRRVHGAIVPDHVLIEPLKHEVLHIGWAHAVDPKLKQKVAHVIQRWEVCYPGEVWDRQPVSCQTDIYMAGRTIALLLGWNHKTHRYPGSVPKELVAVVEQCTAEKPGQRFATGRQAFDEFTRVVRGLWGNQYRPLVLPGKAS